MEDKTLSSGGNGHQTLTNLIPLIGLRQRVIGVRLKQARLKADVSLEDLAEKAWTSPSLLDSYELGEAPVPLPDLEVLIDLLSQTVRDYQDQHGPIGAWASRQRHLNDFLELPAELQAFVAKPD